MIELINTELLLEEIGTDGHAPLKFLCDNNKNYYCKYLNAFNRSELNLLAYEMVASHLLDKLSIPTPKVALVNVIDGTLNKSKIHFNRRLRVGNICFGSQEVKPAQELQSIQSFSKKDYNKIINPYDIVKIAIFDLWVNNMDRGRHFDDGVNYNLLLASVDNRQRIYAFDNAFIFGGVNEIGTFNYLSPVSGHNKLVSSPFYKAVVQYISVDKLKEIVDNFVPLLSVSYIDLISNVLNQLPNEWGLTLNLDNRIDAFLTNNERIITIKNTILQSKK